MRVLIDSHALIWYVDQDNLLTATAHAAISDPTNDLLLSAGSIWEIAIKVGLGKLDISLPFAEWMRTSGISRVTVLPITVQYADVQAGLPRHHGDPFDLLLVAHARVDDVAIVSADTTFDLYGIQRIW